MVTTVGLALTVVGQINAEEHADLWLSEFPAGNMSSGWTFLGAVLRVGQPSGPPVVLEAPRSVTGTGTDPVPPNNCALLVRKQSTLGGRQGRGRFYVPLTSTNENLVDARGMINTAHVAALQGAWDNLYDGMDPVLLHDSTSPAQNPTPITKFVVDRQIATQRKRMR